MSIQLTRMALFAAFILLGGLAGGIRPAAAAEFVFDPGFLQADLENLAEDVGLTVSFLQAAPAEPLGLLHFDIGVEVNATKINPNAGHWQRSVDNPPDYLPVPKIRARVGLPLGVDIGAIYSYVPGINLSLLGGEIKWAVYPGGVVMPAIAIRGSYTTLLGIDELELQTYAFDASISKGFAIFTPYVGVGQVWISADVNDPTIVIPISPEHLSRTRGFVGLEIGIPVVSLVLEAAFSTVQTYTVRLSVGWN
jgi:hypothetical protein